MVLEIEGRPMELVMIEPWSIKPLQNLGGRIAG